MHNVGPKHFVVELLPRLHLHLHHTYLFPSTPKFNHKAFLPFSTDAKHFQPQDLTPAVPSAWNVLSFGPTSLHLVSSYPEVSA